MKSEKPAATTTGIIKLRNELTMKHNTPNQNNFQSRKLSDAELGAMRRREMLESTKLSRSLFGDVEQKLPRRESFIRSDAPPPVVVAVCAGCGARLDLDDQMQKLFTGCRRCISIYGRLDAAFAENAERKKKQMLEKMMRGEK